VTAAGQVSVQTDVIVLELGSEVQDSKGKRSYSMTHEMKSLIGRYADAVVKFLTTI
jgi:hypothetical protein